MTPAIRAVLFDVGGPLDTEEEDEEAIDRAIRAAVESEGIRVSDEAYAAAADWAVDAFAPNAYQAIVWRLVAGDAAIAQRLTNLALSARRHQWRDGLDPLLEWLRERGIRLGLAANQPATTIAALDEAGLGQFFAHREVSGHHGYRKPDVRLFLRACDDLGLAPDECVMVGDRIDNDIVPARVIGMRTILFRTGRHRGQRPRSLDEVPDVEVATVAGLRRALERLLAPR